jgi:hypothetical protein
MKLIRLFSIVVLALSPSISLAFSYIDNRGLLPIGDTEALMANTGVALSSSTGAVYYNPAGLASLTQNHLSISANSYLSTQSDLNPIQTFDGTNMNFHAEGLQTIPTTFVSTGQFGDYHYAFSILVPHQIKVQDSTAYSSVHYPSIQFSRTNSFQLLMAGPSAATRILNTYDVGVGCFYTMYTTTQETTFTANTNGAINAAIQGDYFDATVNGLMCNAGAQVRLTDAWRAGLTVRSPFMMISNKATSTLFVQNPTTGKSATVGPQVVSADYKIPVDVSFGLEYKAAVDLTMYGDVSCQFGTTQNSGDLNASDIVTNATARSSLGGRYAINTSFDLFAGFAYNPSSVSISIDNVGENYLEGTVGTRWSSGNTNLSLGAMYAHSTGSKPTAVMDFQFNKVGEGSASVETRAFGVLLSSGYIF